jgi:hypothetical protein
MLPRRKDCIQSRGNGATDLTFAVGRDASPYMAHTSHHPGIETLRGILQNCCMHLLISYYYARSNIRPVKECIMAGSMGRVSEIRDFANPVAAVTQIQSKKEPFY